LHVLLVPEHLARRLHLRARAAVGVIGLDDLSQGALLPRQPGHLLVVGGNLRPPHLLLDLAITARDRFQTVNHFVFPALPALPGSAGQPPLNSVTTLKPTTSTTNTTRRNPAPRRGCSVLARRTDGTSSAHPDSKALMVLCSAPWYRNTRRTSRKSAIAAR